MTKITSAVTGLALTLAVAGLSFAQTAATSPVPARDSMASASPAKKHVKKIKKNGVKTVKPAAAAPVVK